MEFEVVIINFKILFLKAEKVSEFLICKSYFIYFEKAAELSSFAE